MVLGLGDYLIKMEHSSSEQSSSDRESDHSETERKHKGPQLHLDEAEEEDSSDSSDSSNASEVGTKASAKVGAKASAKVGAKASAKVEVKASAKKPKVRRDRLWNYMEHSHWGNNVHYARRKPIGTPLTQYPCMSSSNLYC